MIRRNEKGSAVVISLIISMTLAGMMIVVFNLAVTQKEAVEVAIDEAEGRATAAAALQLATVRITLPANASASLEDRVADATLGGDPYSNLDGGIGGTTGGNNRYPTTDYSLTTIDTSNMLPFGVGACQTQVTLSDPVVINATTTDRYITIRSTGVGEGTARGTQEIASILESVILARTVTKSITQPRDYKQGDHVLPGGVGIGSEKKLNRGVTYFVDKDAKISGYDHDIDGENPSLTEGTPALGLSEDIQQAWNRSAANTTPGTLEAPGPDNIDNNMSVDLAVLNEAVQAAVDNHDEKFVPSSGDSSWARSSGTYGSVDDPKVLWVDGSNWSQSADPLVKLSGDFQGYGILLITVSNGSQISAPVLEVSNNSGGWTGLIMIVPGNGTKVTNNAMVDIGGKAQIVGGLSVIARDAVTGGHGMWQEMSQGNKTGTTLHLRDEAQVEYSSAAVACALNGLDMTVSDSSTTTTSVTTYSTVVASRQVR